MSKHSPGTAPMLNYLFTPKGVAEADSIQVSFGKKETAKEASPLSSGEQRLKKALDDVFLDRPESALNMGEKMRLVLAQRERDAIGASLM